MKGFSSVDRQTIKQQNDHLHEVTKEVYPFSERKPQIKEFKSEVQNIEEKQTESKYVKSNYKTKEFDQLKYKCRKQEELLYIYKNQFQKLEQIYYGIPSQVLDQQPLDYEKTEMILRDIVTRAANGRSKPSLPNAPKIYKKRNVKTYTVGSII